jgi:uroporphyrinogen-III synthase
MRVLVTRPASDAEPLAAALSALGHEAVVAPLLSIQPLAMKSEDLQGVQALLATSANAVRSYASAGWPLDLPLLAVGDATAEAAHSAGFAQVTSAAGDAAALARLVQQRLRREDGPLLHIAGEVVKPGLAESLRAAGFEIRRAKLYRARAVKRLPQAARQALVRNELDAVLFFSPRTAQTFVSLLEREALAPTLGAVTAVCLSHAVAQPLSALPWQAVRVAAEPSAEALLACLAAEPKPVVRGPAQAQNEKTLRPKASPAYEPTDETVSDSSTNGEQNPDQKSTEPQSGKAAASAERKSKAGGPAAEIIATFGGIRPTASKLGIAVSTVQGWKERGVIPEARHQEIREAALRHQIALDEALLRASAGAAGEAGRRRRPEAAPAAERQQIRMPSSAMPEKAEAAAAAERAKPAEAAPRTPERPLGREREREQASQPSVAATTAGPSVATGPARGNAVLAFVLGAVVLAVGVLGTVALRDFWLPILGEEAAFDTARVEALEQRLGGMEARLQDGAAAAGQAAALEQKLEALSGEVSGLSAALEEVGKGGVEEARVAALESEIEGLRQQLTGEIEGLASRTAQGSERALDLGDRLSALEQRVATLAEETEQARSALSADAALALAVAQLRDALRLGEPYARSLDLVRRHAPEEAEVQQAVMMLAAHAEAGVPTEAALARRFDLLAPDIVAAGAGDGEAGMLGGVMRRLSTVVTVRPSEPDPEAEGSGALVTLAEARLRDGDLAGAVAALKRLQGAAAETAQPWIEVAQARLDAGQALDNLSAAVVREVAPAATN